MRALVARSYGEPESVLSVQERPSPEPGPGCVRVRVGAAALNLPDALTCRGNYVLRPVPPFVPGVEASGTVVALGAGVDPSALGRRVVAAPELPDGGLAQEAIFVAQRLYPVPASVEFVDAAAMYIAFNSAHVGLHRRARLQAGETLLVLAGAGGVGSAAVQLGADAGARVIAAAGTPTSAACAPSSGHGPPSTTGGRAGPHASRS